MWWQGGEWSSPLFLTPDKYIYPRVGGNGYFSNRLITLTGAYII
jgi:hypothetical protein